MIEFKKITRVFIVIGVLITQFVHGQKNSDKFEFQFENKTLRGLIESPIDKNPSAIIIIISGHGKTNFVIGNWWAELRDNFVNSGLAVCFWDKAGCGESDGEYESISFSKPNDEWLKVQVDNEEYSSKRELVNDLIRQARKQNVQIDWIRAKLEKSEKSGFTNDSKEQILKQSKALLRGC